MPISCTVGIASGPVATVGAFTTDGAGNLTASTADTNIASFNFANAPLTGSYQNADQNGRLELQMTNTSISDGLYPTNFAVYIVNANQAFIMSTDKHSEFTLLAGTAQLQTAPSFSNASMNSAIVGYENAESNPGLLGITLQDVLNFSTATVFRASGNGAGTCNTTNIDMGGLTSTIDNLTGLTSGEKNNLISALLGSYAATGTSSCTVGSNGRGTFNYPNHSGLISALLGLLGLPTGPPDPRVFYLVSPNEGYFLETGYAGLGHFEAADRCTLQPGYSEWYVRDRNHSSKLSREHQHFGVCHQRRSRQRNLHTRRKCGCGHAECSSARYNRQHHLQPVG